MSEPPKISVPVLPRGNWDDYFMELAFMAASRATCRRLAVGAILVQNKRVRGTGYNGSPAGVVDCLDAGCLMRDGHCVRTIHAEANVMLSSDARDRQGSTVYCTDRPCLACTNLIANSGVAEVVYSRPYHRDLDEVQGIFTAAGIQLREHSLTPERIATLTGLPVDHQ